MPGLNWWDINLSLPSPVSATKARNQQRGRLSTPLSRQWMLSSDQQKLGYEVEVIHGVIACKKQLTQPGLDWTAKLIQPSRVYAPSNKDPPLLYQH